MIIDCSNAKVVYQQLYLIMLQLLKSHENGVDIITVLQDFANYIYTPKLVPYYLEK